MAKIYHSITLNSQLSTLNSLNAFSSLSQLIKEIWHKYRALIFIMATGIVVRTIAPFIKDKRTDPAVIVLDEKGRYVISLLSGHAGGANELTRRFAHYVGAEAVITTASDVQGRLSLDLWAMEKNLFIENWDKLKQISARIVNGERIKVYIEQNIEHRTARLSSPKSQNTEVNLPDGLIPVDRIDKAEILITNRVVKSVLSFIEGKKALILRPRNLVLGIGCNRGTKKNQIENTVKEAFRKYGFSMNSIKGIATIDIKRNEPGLMRFADAYGMEIYFFTRDELNTVNGIEASTASLKATGAIGIAEPSALLGAKHVVSGAKLTDRLVIPKIKKEDVTLAVAEADFSL
ncbi:MAG: cobalt-precorrin 5A hydrolase [Nitrospirota bacterium]